MLKVTIGLLFHNTNLVILYRFDLIMWTRNENFQEKTKTIFKLLSLGRRHQFQYQTVIKVSS